MCRDVLSGQFSYNMEWKVGQNNEYKKFGMSRIHPMSSLLRCQLYNFIFPLKVIQSMNIFTFSFRKYIEHIIHSTQHSYLLDIWYVHVSDWRWNYHKFVGNIIRNVSYFCDSIGSLLTNVCKIFRLASILTILYMKIKYL